MINIMHTDVDDVLSALNVLKSHWEGQLAFMLTLGK